MHSLFDFQFYRKLTWNLSEKSRQVMGKRWCDWKDGVQKESGSDSQ